MPTRAEPALTNRQDAASTLGPRLRAIRLRHGVGLRELARRLDLSPSAISRFETGKMHPSVRTLFAFASELQITVDEMLFERSWAADEYASTAAAGSSGAPAGPALVLQRADESPAIRLDCGVTWKRLTVWAEDDVEFIETTYDPGGASCPENALVRGDGREFVHVLSGTLRAVVGVDELDLGPGDSLTFPASMPHRLTNVGVESARAIWVVRGRRGAQPFHTGALS